MHSTPFSWRRALRPLLLLCLISLLQLAAHAAPVATVSALSGTLGRRSGNVLTPIRLRTPLNTGDVVSTGRSAKATLLFLDGSQLRMNSNTTVLVTPQTGAGRGHVSIARALSGEVWARLRPGRAIQTSSAIAGVRGTVFDLTVTEEGVSTLAVLEGEVDFYNPFGAVQVREAQQSTARPGAAPTQPITLENPGFIIEWALELERTAAPREMFFVTPDREAARRMTAPADVLRAGDLAFDAGDYTRAARSYDAAAQALASGSSTTLGSSAALEARRGFIALEQGDLPAAETRFSAALATAATGADKALASTGMAWLEIGRGRPTAAETAARAALTADESSRRARIALGVALMRQNGRGEEALREFDAVLALPPDEVTYQARAWRALQLLSLDRREEAAREARLAAQAAPYSALAQGNLAIVLTFAGDTSGAVRAARAATRLNPESVAARVAFGEALLAGGDSDKAELEAARAVALDPQLVQARYLLGVASAARRDYGHAAAELQAALRIAPDFLPAAAALARVETARGRNREAVQLISSLQERRGPSTATLSALGETYFEQLRYKEAEAAYRAAIKLNPASAQAWAELALVLDYTNRSNEAIIAGQKAVQLAPLVGEYHALLGQIYLNASLTGQATRELRTALALDPRNALARGILGTNDPDGRVVVNSLSQSFLFDPRVTRRVLPGGVHAQLGSTVGDKGWSQDAVGRFEALDGKLRFVGAASYSREDDDGANDEKRAWVGFDYLTYTPNPRTTILAGATGTRDETGFPGPRNNLLSQAVGFDVNADDTRTSRFFSQQLTVRQRLSGNRALWLSALYEPSRFIQNNPDQLTFPFEFVIPPGSVGPGVPAAPLFDFLRTDTKTHAFVPEARLDINLNTYSRRPATLTLGATHQRSTTKAAADLATPGLDVFLSHVDTDVSIGYAQIAQRLSPRLSYVAQLRGRHEHTRTRTSGNGTDDDARDKRLLGQPSFLVNYQLNNSTVLRVLGSTQQQELTTSALVPTETLITGEPEAALRGSAARSQTFEIDMERYLGDSGFLKLFAFSSRASQLGLGGVFQAPGLYAPQITLNRARSMGLGVRYEKRLSSTLFANTTLIARRSSHSSPGQLFDGGSAPYQPRNSAALGLDYLHPSGAKVHMNLRREGSFFADDPIALAVAGPSPRPRFGARWVADVRFEYEPTVRIQYFVGVENLFNKRGIFFADYPSRGRALTAGVIKRF